MIDLENFLTKALDSIVNPILSAIAKGIGFIFSVKWLSVLIWIIAVNIIGFVLMMRDKQYAQEGKRRVRERTLLSTAAVGGSLGIYAGMYKFNHKTLHKKFTIFVPVIMLIQVAVISFEIFTLVLR